MALGLADLVLVASRVLGLDTAATLDLLDREAAQAALVTAEAADRRGPAEQAAALLCALVRERPFRRANQQISLLVTLQWLGLRGWQVDLGPPNRVETLLAEVAAGMVGPDELGGWLAPRVSRGGRNQRKEARMSRWLPGRMLRRDRFGRFTDPARKVVLLGELKALELGNNRVSTGHLLLGLLHDGQGIPAQALASLGVSHASVQARHATITEIITRHPELPLGHAGVCNPRSSRQLLRITGRVKNVLFEHAPREARLLGDNHIGPEHLLLGLLYEDDATVEDLTALGAPPTRVRQEVMRLLTGQRPTPPEDPVGRLQGEVDRLRALLRQHGIDPNGGLAQPA